jgi:hypothetical protein
MSVRALSLRVHLNMHLCFRFLQDHPRGNRVFLLLGLGIQGILLGGSAWCHSPTVDEVGHLAAGLHHWHTGCFDWYCVNPPLVRLWATWPLVAVGVPGPTFPGPEAPVYRPEFRAGYQFFQEQGEEVFWYLTLARWMCIPLVWLGGYVCFRWGRELYGPGAGLVAFLLWSFCPLVLGHGALITPDVGAASLGVLAWYVCGRWLQQPTWGRAWWAGVGLGLAFLTKTTWILLWVLWPLVWLGWGWARGSLRQGAWRWQGGQMLLSLFLALVVLHIGYGFEGSCYRLEDYPFTSQALTVGIRPDDRQNRFHGTVLGKLPVPLPRYYLLGMDIQRRDFELGLWSYLRGEWRRQGWWYYYLYGLGVKSPLGNWLLLGMALGACVFGGHTVGGRAAEAFCWRQG